MFTFHWCGLHTRFGFMTSGVCVLNVLHWTWLNDRFGFLCALHICTTNTLRASDCISNICSVCLLLNGNAFFSSGAMDASNRSIVRPFSTHTLNSMHTYYVDVSWVIGWMNFFQTWIPFSYKKLHENDSKKAKQSQCVPCIFRTSNVFVWAWRFFLSSNVFFSILTFTNANHAFGEHSMI